MYNIINDIITRCLGIIFSLIVFIGFILCTKTGSFALCVSFAVLSIISCIIIVVVLILYSYRRFNSKDDLKAFLNNSEVSFKEACMFISCNRDIISDVVIHTNYYKNYKDSDDDKCSIKYLIDTDGKYNLTIIML